MPNAPTLEADTDTPHLSPAPTGIAPPRADTGLEVRDHRPTAESAGGRVLGGGGHALEPAAPKLTPTTTSFVHAKVKDAVLGCGRQIPEGERGSRAKVGARMKLAIQGGTARPSEVEPLVSDVTGTSLDAVKQCIRDALQSGEWPGAGEADGEGYELTLGYVVR